MNFVYNLKMRKKEIIREKKSLKEIINFKLKNLFFLVDK